ncbi:MAG: LemA family protein [Gammaproteobacteria bacterium]|nr:LemA family protein [Gammaproteobacteria bacterium]
MELIWILVLGLLAWAVWIFNRLVRLRNRVRSAWGDIDVQLTRRHDLVPQLVAAVAAYASHERALLTQVTELRAAAVATAGPARLADLEASLEQGLSRLLALREDYPALKASENFLSLQSGLSDVEEHLQYARRFYNGAVRDLNDRIAQFPDLLIARPLGFQQAQFYAASQAERSVPDARLPA